MIFARQRASSAKAKDKSAIDWITKPDQPRGNLREHSEVRQYLSPLIHIPYFW
jgi:hypothetical protein